MLAMGNLVIRAESVHHQIVARFKDQVPAPATPRHRTPFLAAQGLRLDFVRHWRTIWRDSVLALS